MRDKYFLLFIMLFLSLHLAIGTNDALQVSVTSSKDKLFPGDSFNLIINFTNLAPVHSNGRLRDLRYKVTPPYALLTQASYTDYLNVGYLGQGVSVLGIIPVRVSESTVDGDYIILVNTSYRNNEGSLINVSNNFNLRISDAGRLLTLSNVSTSKELTPGEDFNILLNLIAESAVKNIELMISPQNGLILNNDNNKRVISGLNARESAIINYSMSVSTDSKAGSVIIPLTINYYKNGIKYVDELSLGFNIKGKAELSLSGVETRPNTITLGAPFNLRIELENTGTSDAQNITVHLSSNLEGIQTGFMNSIKKSNTGDIVFNLESSQLTQLGLNTLELEVSYNDDLGVQQFRKLFSINFYDNDLTNYYITITLAVMALFLLLSYMLLKKFRK